MWHGTHRAGERGDFTTSGLRIMPRSGGRLEGGIYLAAQDWLSSDYVRGARDGRAVMILVEGAFGREHGITADDSASPPMTPHHRQ